MVTEVEKVAQLALKLGRKHLDDYSATRSRHDFIQAQLMSCLVLRAFLKTTYRGVLDILAASQALRDALGFEDKLPHFTTLQKFHARSRVPQVAQAIVGSLGQMGALPEGQEQAAAIDSTGLATDTASPFFRSRQGGKCHQFIKLSVIVWCTSLLPLAMSVDVGPSNDRKQAPKLLEQAQAVGRPSQLLADAGYDSNWMHEYCRERWQVESIIKPFTQRKDGTRGGKYRAQMSPEHLKSRGYGKRWAVESFISAMKRKVGWSLTSRKDSNLLGEAACKLLAYAIHR